MVLQTIRNQICRICSKGIPVTLPRCFTRVRCLAARWFRWLRNGFDSGLDIRWPNLHHAFAFWARQDFADGVFAFNAKLRTAGHASYGVGFECIQIALPLLNSEGFILSLSIRFANPKRFISHY